MSPIEHVIIIVKENHGFDNYFGTFPGADGMTMPRSSNPPPQDPDHRHPAWMQRAKNAIRAQFVEQDIPAYFQYARQFTLCDRYFTDVAGPSSPNHLMLIAADSPIIANPPRYRLPQGTGAFNLPSLPANLEHAGKTWRNYGGYAFDFISGLRGRNTLMSQQFVLDAAAGNLPTVSWVYASHETSEHPPDPSDRNGRSQIGNVTKGMLWTISQVEAVVRGGLWPKCVIFITWDDWGGWYDHVAPPLVEKWNSTTDNPSFNGEQFRYGGRVPCLVLSPYAKSGHVSHAQHSHVSLLKFVEQQFGLPSLNARTAAADAMEDCFDFKRAPAPPPVLDMAAVRVASALAAPRARWSSGRTLNVAYSPGSPAAEAYAMVAGLPSVAARAGRDRQAEAGALPPKIPPMPEEDLVFHQGKTIASLTFTNLYVGRQAWDPDDIQRIDEALAKAMSDERLNNVIAQYFPGRQVTSTFQPLSPLAALDTGAPSVFSQGDVEALTARLHDDGSLGGFDFGSTVFNFLLPPGTVLNQDAQPTAQGGQALPPAEPQPGRLQAAAELVKNDEPGDSQDGLGGYHGSVHVQAADGTDEIVYYAVGVFSEDRNGRPNGIPVFDASWKNVVATFYHELCEARTDPDVEDVNRTQNDALLGWVSASGQECGDFPIKELGELGLPNSVIFREVDLSDGSGTVPVQFQWSNAVHGPEGPIDQPH